MATVSPIGSTLLRRARRGALLLAWPIAALAAEDGVPRDSGGCRSFGDVVEAVVMPRAAEHHDAARAAAERAPRSFTRLCYDRGESWVEPDLLGGDDDGVRLYQRLDLYRPQGTGRREPLPIVVWAHPSGADESFNAGGLDSKVMPALRQGFAFVSLEYRHPRMSQPRYPAWPDPERMVTTDIGRAVQWLRFHAGTLGIDAEHVFLLGQSRGALALLTAVDDDLAIVAPGDGHRRLSSKPRAAFAVSAQSSYEHRDLRAMLMRRSSVPVPPADERVDYHAYFDEVDRGYDGHRLGSVVGALDADDPPIWARFDRTPPRARLGLPVAEPGLDPLTEGLCVEPAYGRYGGAGWAFDSGVSCLDMHHPSFGAEIAAALRRSGAAADSAVQFGPPPPRVGARAIGPGEWAAWLDAIGQQFFDDYACYFAGQMEADANARRVRRIGRAAAEACRGEPHRAWPDRNRLPTAGAQAGR